MEVIELVIKIPEEKYNEIKGYVEIGYSLSVVQRAIVEGTPLPKGHGRLIDADKIEYWKNNRPGEIGYYYIPKYFVDNAPTVIEADTESEE